MKSLVSQAEYAKHRGMNRSSVTRLRRRGGLVMVGQMVDVEASDRELDACLPGSAYDNAKKLDLICRARLRKLELDVAEGRRIDGAAVQKLIADAARAFRDAVLAIPDRVALIVTAETDPKKVNALLRAELDRALDELGSAMEKI